MINRATWNWCIAAMWFVLPALALRYWQVWDLLPLRLATHFDVGGRPNGWMTREGSMLFVICLCAIIVVPGSFILSRVRKPQLFSGALLAWFCVVLGVIFYGNESILTYNLYRQPVKLGPIIIVVMMAVAG